MDERSNGTRSARFVGGQSDNECAVSLVNRRFAAEAVFARKLTSFSLARTTLGVVYWTITRAAGRARDCLLTQKLHRGAPRQGCAGRKLTSAACEIPGSGITDEIMRRLGVAQSSSFSHVKLK